MITNKLIVEIKSKINDNQKQGITGGILQGVLLDMVESLSEAYPQIYTEEQKAQARANIDALSNYDGAITKEKLSAEVQAILDDVANKQNITDESLATIAKTIVGAINEVYNGGLKDASIATSKIEDGAITEPKLDTDLVNVITSAVQPAELASAIATALASYVAKADIVSITGSATDKVMSQRGVTEAINGVTNKVTELSEKVDGKQDNIDSLSADEKAALLVSLGLGKIGVVSQKQTWNDVGVEPAYVMSKKVKGFISQDDIDILISYGFVFNEGTGYFELNGLTDISLQEALNIVAVGKPNFSLCDTHFAFKKIRTNLPIFDNQNYNAAYFGNGISNKIRMGAMAYQSDIEVFVYGQFKKDDNYINSGFKYSTIEQVGLAFKECHKIEKISIIPGTSMRFFDTFARCLRLKELELVYLTCDVNLSDSSLLSSKSIHIMIANASNTGAITITLHSNAKARWEASEYYAEDSQTIVTKNITIA